MDTFKPWLQCALAALLLVPLLAIGQAASGTRVSGRVYAVTEPGGYLSISFTCLGAPTCTGIYNWTEKYPECTNTYSGSDALTITGIDLSRTGAISGTAVLTGTNYHVQPPGPGPGGGPCVFIRDGGSMGFTVTGNWSGSTGTIVFTSNGFNIPGTFSATVSTVSPVFPMTVAGSITPTIANVQATFQPRPQDVGTTASTFVFALAPATLVPNAVVTKQTHLGLVAPDRSKDHPVPCVLAQLNSTGQLVGATASGLQPYTTGVLNAQGQSVNILNNVATPNVAGATFFVGYGANGSSMINNGVNREAIAIPSGVSCNPLPPQTGWWWNPAEGGRGFSIEVQGNNLFFAAFHYDTSGRATWNVSPGPISLGGSYFTSDLYNVTDGQALGGAYRAPNAVKAGAITLSFSSPTQGTMTWPGGSVPIQRQPLVPGGLEALPQENVPETGGWWNPQESGRGFFIEWQKGYADIAGYMYDDQGRPTWYIAVYETPNARVFTGNWWTFANGQSMGGTYRAATRTSDNFAPLSINFTSSTTAVMTLPNGRTTNLIRQRF